MAGGGIKINNIKVSGGADGKTPIFKIEDGVLYYTYGSDLANAIWYSLGEVKGEKGRDGVDGKNGSKLVSQELVGQDVDGGNIYQQTFDDGTIAYFTAPRGQKGEGGTGGGTDVDDVLSLDSENPVQNKAITAELNKKLDKVSTTFPDVDRAYIIKPNGTQSIKQVTKWYPTPDAIMLRDEKGYAKAFTPLNETPNIYHLINYEYFTAKAMTKRYRHIIRMSTDYTTIVDNTERTYDEVVFAIESSRNTKYTLENDLDELIAELAKYGTSISMLPSALYAVMYHSDGRELPQQIYIRELADYGGGAELYFIVDGGDTMAEISSFTDDVFEI